MHSEYLFLSIFVSNQFRYDQKARMSGHDCNSELSPQERTKLKRELKEVERKIVIALERQKQKEFERRKQERSKLKWNPQSDSILLREFFLFITNVILFSCGLERRVAASGRENCCKKSNDVNATIKIVREKNVWTKV